MSVELDHAIVPARDRVAAAELLATLLGVPWAESGVGPFCPVYVNDGLTLDFDQAEGAFPVQHYCFRVSEAEFDGIVDRIRARGIEYRSSPHGPIDRQVNTQHGGRIVYWSEPDGHVWEALTVSYARQPMRGTPGAARSAVPVEPTPRIRRSLVVAGVVASFVGLAGTIVILSQTSLVTIPMAKLMLAALMGIYVGFGVLIAVYRLLGKLK